MILDYDQIKIKVHISNWKKLCIVFQELVHWGKEPQTSKDDASYVDMNQDRNQAHLYAGYLTPLSSGQFIVVSSNQGLLQVFIA